MTADPQERLRYWIRTLGNLLGETIIEQEGSEVFDHEEAIRAQAKAWRAGDRQAQGSITRLVSSLVADIPYTLAVLKAFTTYFQLVNLAEERQRVSTLRQARAVRSRSRAYPCRRRSPTRCGNCAGRALGGRCARVAAEAVHRAGVHGASHGDEAPHRARQAEDDRVDPVRPGYAGPAAAGAGSARSSSCARRSCSCGRAMRRATGRRR